MFLLFEVEWGTLNLIVPRVVYERHRLLARAEPLLLAKGRLERAEGVINVLVRELAALEGFLDQSEEETNQPAASASVHRLPEPERSSAAGEQAAGSTAEEQAEDAQVGSSMRAVAPAVQSFAMGRRRA
jgi:error-prone DNA polymerase